MTKNSVAARSPVTAKQVAQLIATVALEHKATGVEIIVVADKVDYADCLVIMSGRSDRQVAGLARHIDKALAARGRHCLATEGLPGGAWVLMDYDDVIVHIFHEEVRDYYKLESLWLDAERLIVKEDNQRHAMAKSAQKL